MIIFLFVIPLIKSQDNLIFGNENGNFDFQKCGDSVSCLTMEPDCEPGTSNCGLALIAFVCIFILTLSCSDMMFVTLDIPSVSSGLVT